MRTLLAVLAWPLMAGAALAAEPLSDPQMDAVSGGFSAVSIDDAEGLVGESGIVMIAAGSVSQVFPLASATLGEKRSTIFQSTSAGQASTATFTYTPFALAVPQ
jgi:hypothetical protein